MIDYFGYITTMSWRVAIALEELGLDYRFTPVNIAIGEQFTPEHTARNPMQKVPVIIDHDPEGGGEPITVFESGAILLAGRLGPPGQAHERAEFYAWFFWILNSYGEALTWPGLMFHTEQKYRLFDKTDYGEATYSYFTNASVKAHAKLDQRLDGRDFICGEFSIIDIAAIGTTVPLLLHGVEDISVYPDLARWYNRVRDRAGVKAGLAVGSDARANLPGYYAAALFDDRWSA